MKYGMKERRLLQYNVYRPRGLPEGKNAGGKAVRDSCQILKACGFADLYDASAPRAMRIAQKLFAIPRLRRWQVLLVQYPATSGFWLRYLSLFRSAKKIALVHDTDSIRLWKINGGGALQTRSRCFRRLTASLP